MQFLRSIPHENAFKQGSVVAIGNFDGVHRGHQALLKKLRAKANELHLPLVVVIFEPQAREFFMKQKAPVRLSTLRGKVAALRDCQVDVVYCLRFNLALSQLSAEDFVKEVLFKQLNVHYLLIGQDFRFGCQRTGDIQLLRQMMAGTSRCVDVQADVAEENIRISSTHIREALQRDELAQAAIYLGHPYSLCARVIHGEALGRQWGVPTANMQVYHDTFPLKGIYCVEVARANGERRKGVAYAGRRPSLDNGQCLVEVHLFDFNDSLYGERLQVFFLHKLRDEVKFASLDALIAAIHADVSSARAYFSE